MGAALRIVGTWVVATALIVLGVDVAIEQVARDVTTARPAPLAPSEVGERLRERGEARSTTTAVESSQTTTTSMPETPATTPPASTREPTGPAAPGTGPSGEVERPGTPRPAAPGVPAGSGGTTTSLPTDASAHPDERERPQGP